MCRGLYWGGLFCGGGIMFVILLWMLCVVFVFYLIRNLERMDLVCRGSNSEVVCEDC